MQVHGGVRYNINAYIFVPLSNKKLARTTPFKALKIPYIGRSQPGQRESLANPCNQQTAMMLIGARTHANAHKNICLHKHPLLRRQKSPLPHFLASLARSAARDSAASRCSMLHLVVHGSKISRVSVYWCCRLPKTIISRPSLQQGQTSVLESRLE